MRRTGAPSVIVRGFVLIWAPSQPEGLCGAEGKSLSQRLGRGRRGERRGWRRRRRLFLRSEKWDGEINCSDERRAKW